MANLILLPYAAVVFEKPHIFKNTTATGATDAKGLSNNGGHVGLPPLWTNWTLSDRMLKVISNQGGRTHPRKARRVELLSDWR